MTEKELKKAIGTDLANANDLIEKRSNWRVKSIR